MTEFVKVLLLEKTCYFFISLFWQVVRDWLVQRMSDMNQKLKTLETAVKKFDGFDILINNASAISLTGTVKTPMKKFDLMHNVNVRSTFLL